MGVVDLHMYMSTTPMGEFKHVAHCTPQRLCCLKLLYCTVLYYTQYLSSDVQETSTAACLVSGAAAWKRGVFNIYRGVVRAEFCVCNKFPHYLEPCSTKFNVLSFPTRQKKVYPATLKPHNWHVLSNFHQLPKHLSYQNWNKNLNCVFFDKGQQNQLTIVAKNPPLNKFV